ncbi:MAG: hypothetical protein HY915_06290 [Desulfovibrio sp.]|nr:hypothetical protein [Desulfovibrio sp.]
MNDTKKPSTTVKTFWNSLQGSQKNKAESAIHLTSMKDEFLDELNSLFRSIKAWLNPGIEQELVHFREGTTQIDEEMLGKSYMAPVLFLSFPTVGKVVEVVPVGAFIVGAAGRVDLRSGIHESILLRGRQEDGSFKWCVKVPPIGGRGSAAYPLLTEDLFLSEIQRILV